MEYTVENLSKGRKKEDLIKLILDMQADMRKSKNEWEKSIDALAEKNKELSDRLNGRTDEYDRWKKYNGEFLSRFMSEYMEAHKDDIVEDVADKVAEGLELDGHDWGDYYSHGTDVVLKYKGRDLGSASINRG